MDTMLEKYFRNLTLSASNEQIKIANMLDDVFEKADLGFFYVVCGENNYWLVLDLETYDMNKLVHLKMIS